MIGSCPRLVPRAPGARWPYHSGMDPRLRAAELFQQAYDAQMRGDLPEAVRLYAFLGDLEEAIACCKRAIEVDPSFGNPYNDIGAYLIERGELDAAIPWLQKAKKATRYEAPQFPRFNLGRVYLAKDMLSAALREFEEALEVQPGYEPALGAIAAVKRRLN